MSFRIYDILKNKKILYDELNIGFRYYTIWSIILYIFSKNFYDYNVLNVTSSLLIMSCSIIGSTLIYMNLDDFSKEVKRSKKTVVIIDLFIHIIPLLIVLFYYPIPKLLKEEYLTFIVYMLLLGGLYLCCYKPEKIYNSSKLSKGQLLMVNILTQSILLFMFFI